jgi:type IV pilus assembly protein PilB
MSQQRKIGKILVDLGFATKKQIKKVLKIQKQEDRDRQLGQILVDEGVINQKELTRALSEQYDMPVVDLSSMDIPEEIIDAVPRDVAQEYGIVPVRLEDGTLTVAMSDPLDFMTLDNLRFVLNHDVKCVLTTEDQLRRAHKHYYDTDTSDTEFDSMLDELTDPEDDDIEIRDSDTDLDEMADEAEGEESPVIRLVTLIISEAVKTGASDIHIEPMENRLRVRYRVDGICREVDSPPKRLQGSIISRLKIMAGMDIAEKRKPQDGRIKITLMGRDLDLRVSALPSTHGESLVMRILDKEEGLKSLEALGFHPEDKERFDNIISRPNGIFLVTGPTGSGKTTTLYASLQKLNRPDVKIITAENPVEYELEGINQSQVNHKIGLDFQRILRAILRQSPNIILVGEIRDQETAEIAIQAALTGHLVFSTLHTNDAPSALTRLVDIGVKPFLVSSSVQAVMAQRLIRVLCPACKEPYEPDETELRAVGLNREDLEGKKVYKSVGCGECDGDGFSGRTAVFELMEMNSTIREMTFNQEDTRKITEQARLSGMTTLLEDGVRKVLDGKSTFQEVLRVAQREDIVYT